MYIFTLLLDLGHGNIVSFKIYTKNVCSSESPNSVHIISCSKRMYIFSITWPTPPRFATCSPVVFTNAFWFSFLGLEGTSKSFGSVRM